MATLVALLAPSSNRVYAGQAPAVTAAELGVLAAATPGAALLATRTTSIAGVSYLEMEFAEEPAPELLGQLAAAHALFARVGDLLRPLPLHRVHRFDDDLLTIPKYPGKTNEQFTRVLLNVTLASTAWGGELPGRRFCVLDPMAGRGTTLSWALTLGHDAAGVELDARDVEAYATFLRTYLQRKRVKHSLNLHPVRRSGVRIADLLECRVGPDKVTPGAGPAQHLDVFAADTVAVADLFGRRRFDAVVTDAPYGVAHGSHLGLGRHRSPADLLAAAVPAWVSVLRRGGAVGIAWNIHGLARADLAAICVAAGLEVCDDGPYRRLAHRVDAGIHRDVLVARLPLTARR